jgi:hypothetical protein
MSTAIPVALRRATVERAAGRCEYCRKPPISFYPHEVDHVVALKHGGATSLDNLALACFQCNRYKGSDLASVDPQTGEVTPLFNLRTQLWSDHFQLEAGIVRPLTPQGRVTVFLLRLNSPERITERRALNIVE